MSQKPKIQRSRTIFMPHITGLLNGFFLIVLTYYDIIDIISLSLFKSTVHQSTGDILVKVTSLLSWFYSFGVCFYVRYNFPLPVSVLTELLGALVHCWSLAFRVMVRFWLHVSGGREHIPSDVELQSNV